MWIIWVIVAIAFIVFGIIITKIWENHWLGWLVWIVTALALLSLVIIMQRYNPASWQAFVNFVGAMGR